MENGSGFPAVRRRAKKRLGGWFKPSMPFPMAPGAWEEMWPASMTQPMAEISETDEEVVLTVELPGVEKEDISIKAEDDRIEVSVEEEYEKEEGKEGGGEYRYVSRYTGFAGSYSTPAPISPDDVKASYKNGVLEVKAKKTHKEERKKIEVE